MLSFSVHHYYNAISGPSELATDNQAARDLSYNPENHQRTKHVERRHFYIRDMVEALELRVPLVPTKQARRIRRTS